MSASAQSCTDTLLLARFSDSPHFLIGRSICFVRWAFWSLLFSLSLVYSCCCVVCRCQMPLSSRAAGISGERRWWLEYKFRVYYSEMFSQGFFRGDALDRQRQRGERHKSRAKEYQRWSPAVDTRPSLNSAALKKEIFKKEIFIPQSSWSPENFFSNNSGFSGFQPHGQLVVTRHYTHNK